MIPAQGKWRRERNPGGEDTIAATPGNPTITPTQHARVGGRFPMVGVGRHLEAKRIGALIPIPGGRRIFLVLLARVEVFRAVIAPAPQGARPCRTGVFPLV